ncbi:hypothetical protein acdb102_20220 [Acidothermaceae bacterium B102]|nr:hypothetical protein acdb102_20220 [Acidothermaceae bacterium B102]
MPVSQKMIAMTPIVPSEVMTELALSGFTARYCTAAFTEQGYRGDSLPWLRRSDEAAMSRP